MHQIPHGGDKRNKIIPRPEEPSGVPQPELEVDETRLNEFVGRWQREPNLSAKMYDPQFLGDLIDLGIDNPSATESSRIIAILNRPGLTPQQKSDAIKNVVKPTQRANSSNESTQSSTSNNEPEVDPPNPPSGGGRVEVPSNYAYRAVEGVQSQIDRILAQFPTGAIPFESAYNGPLRNSLEKLGLHLQYPERLDLRSILQRDIPDNEKAALIRKIIIGEEKPLNPPISSETSLDITRPSYLLRDRWNTLPEIQRDRLEREWDTLNVAQMHFIKVALSNEGIDILFDYKVAGDMDDNRNRIAIRSSNPQINIASILTQFKSEFSLPASAEIYNLDQIAASQRSSSGHYKQSLDPEILRSNGIAVNTYGQTGVRQNQIVEVFEITNLEPTTAI